MRLAAQACSAATSYGIAQTTDLRLAARSMLQEREAMAALEAAVKRLAGVV